jgi:hypothetical protein
MVYDSISKFNFIQLFANFTFSPKRVNSQPEDGSRYSANYASNGAAHREFPFVIKQQDNPCTKNAT